MVSRSEGFPESQTGERRVFALGERREVTEEVVYAATQDPAVALGIRDAIVEAGGLTDELLFGLAAEIRLARSRPPEPLIDQ